MMTESTAPGEASFTVVAKAFTAAPVATRSCEPEPLGRAAHATAGLIPWSPVEATILPLVTSTTQTRPPRRPRAANLPSGVTAIESHAGTSAAMAVVH